MILWMYDVQLGNTVDWLTCLCGGVLLILGKCEWIYWFLNSCSIFNKFGNGSRWSFSKCFGLRRCKCKDQLEAWEMFIACIWGSYFTALMERSLIAIYFSQILLFFIMYNQTVGKKKNWESMSSKAFNSSPYLFSLSIEYRFSHLLLFNCLAHLHTFHSLNQLICCVLVFSFSYIFYK